MYLWDSLDTAINWKAYEGQKIGEYIQASEGDLWVFSDVFNWWPLILKNRQSWNFILYKVFQKF